MPVHSDEYQITDHSDTASSMTHSTATAPGLVGPGRTLGLLLDRMGHGLEVFLNKRAQQARFISETSEPDIHCLHQHKETPIPVCSVAPHAYMHNPDIAHSDKYQALGNLDSALSMTHSTATAPGLVGPGRTLGVLLDWMGHGLQDFLNKCARKLNLGPEAVARDIRRLCRHKEFSFFVRFVAPYAFVTKGQEKDLQSLCKKLLKYSRSPVLSTQLKALGEIADLAIEDSLIRTTFHNCNLSQLVPVYKEQDLILASSRAFGSIENVEIHNLWTRSLLLRLESKNLTNESPEILALKDSIKNSDTSFVAARYLTKILCSSGIARKLYEEIWDTYLEVAVSFPDNVEWSNINKYGEFPIVPWYGFTNTGLARTLVRLAL
ncbi:hypothetical protein SCHPADRAFT_1001728 [Schizopora paradoxa]|uniref:Uncharacterized protein n=1 Tax=Schizopora paradoxa TaxID=27342 RepID=A0A0H2RCW4_9AGAM|nr:hypothetical protein SCHPADRAFT_1001728 [Schizopora paradoxa]